MRVYLGSDHAGYELKQAIIEHLTKPAATSRSTAAPTPTTPRTTTRRSASPPRPRRVADPDSLGIVIGGSGNGEQIAANKVPGVRCALAWSVETASLAREHNNAQVIGIGGRMHTVEEALAYRRRVPDHPVVGSASATSGASTSSTSTRRPTSPPPVPGAPARPVPEGTPCTGWPGCTSAGSAGRRCGSAARRAGSPTRAAAVDGRVLRKADAWGKHLFHHYDGGARGARPPRAVRHVHRVRRRRLPDPVGQVRMRMVGAQYGTDLRGPTVCEVIAEAEVADVVARLGPDPLRRDADPAPAWARITKSRRPIGALLMDQSVIAGVGNVYRSELLYRHRIDPYRPGTRVSDGEFDALWTDLVALMKVGVRRGKIVVVRPEDDHGAPSYGAGPAAHLRLPPRRRPVPGVRHRRPHRRDGGPQPVLVPHLPGLTTPNVTFGRVRTDSRSAKGAFDGTIAAWN